MRLKIELSLLVIWKYLIVSYNKQKSKEITAFFFFFRSCFFHLQFFFLLIYRKLFDKTTVIKSFFVDCCCNAISSTFLSAHFRFTCFCLLRGKMQWKKGTKTNEKWNAHCACGFVSHNPLLTVNTEKCIYLKRICCAFMFDAVHGNIWRLPVRVCMRLR